MQLTLVRQRHGGACGLGAVGVPVWHPVQGAVVEGLVGADEHHPGLGGGHGARGRVLPVGR